MSDSIKVLSRFSNSSQLLIIGARGRRKSLSFLGRANQLFVHFTVIAAEHELTVLGKYQGGSAMLILSRRTGESVKIGDEVTVTVLGVKGSQVRLGFAAPQHVAVHREEVYERIKAETSANISNQELSVP